LGRGIALRLAEKGAKVALHYYRNETAANAALAEIRPSITTVITSTWSSLKDEAMGNTITTRKAKKNGAGNCRLIPRLRTGGPMAFAIM